MEKPPYFPFYVGDFLSSRAVAQLEPAQIGAYIMLLAWQWDDAQCTLPADPGVLGYLSRLGDRWGELGPKILELCFTRRGARIWNERLMKERRKYEAKAKAGQEGGLNSGRSRRNGIEAKPKQTRSNAEAETKQSRSKVEVRAVARDPEPEPDSKPENVNGASGAVAPRRAWNHEAGDDWEARFGTKPTRALGIRISANLKALVDAHSWPVVRPAWKRCLAEEGKFATPERFAEKFGVWAEPRAAPPRGDGATWEPYGPVPGSEEWKANVEKARRQG